MEDHKEKRAAAYAIAGVLLLVLFVLAFGFRGEPSPYSEVTLNSSSGENSTQEIVGPSAPVRSGGGASESAGNNSPQNEPAIEDGFVIMRYTKEGFVPPVLEVKRGASVRFLNQSGGSMRLLSNRDGGQNPYPAFDQTKTVGPSEAYEFTFTLPGTWGIKNQFNSVHFGAVVVQ